jgi:hypothetical protein
MRIWIGGRRAAPISTPWSRGIWNGWRPALWAELARIAAGELDGADSESIANRGFGHSSRYAPVAGSFTALTPARLCERS